jgi:hypothetical protein
MTASARAQGYDGLQRGVPQTSPLPLTNGTLQRYVGPHFDAQGRYVPPHYEQANKKPRFRGYFAQDEQARDAQQQRGYKLPPPNYTTPIDPSQEKPIEGR